MAGSIALPMGTVAEVEAAEVTDTEWEDIQSVVSRYYGEWQYEPYTGWSSNTMPDTALLGNGDVGVTSGENNTGKTFYISKGNFWEYMGSPLPIGGVTISEKQEEEIETGINIAPTYKNVTASSVLGDFLPEKAVDGSVEVDNSVGADQWVSMLRNQQGSNDFWLQLEFEEPVTFSRYVVKSDGAVRPNVPGIEANTTRDFKVQISDTGEDGSWTDVDSVTGNTQAVFDKNLENPVTAKFVRLYITKATQETTSDTIQNPRARIAQFELYEEKKEGAETPENLNLALGKPVEVSSQYAGEAQGTLVDGNESTQWTSSTSAMNAAEHWAIVDLGEEKNIGYWVLKNSSEPGCATADFKLQYSNDKTEWTDFAVVTGNTELWTTGALETPITARYVRLSVTKGTQNDNTYARIRELELYEDYVDIGEPFNEKQDILNAEIQTKQKFGDTQTEMRSWLASDENIFVTELTSKASNASDFCVETWAYINEISKRPVTAENDSDSVTVTRSTWNNYVDTAESWTSKAAISTKIIGADGVEAASDHEAGKGTLTFTLEAGETVYIVTSVGGGGRTYQNTGELWDGAVEPEENAAELLEAVEDKDDLTALDQERQAWWKDFWSASYIDFGTGDAQLDTLQKYYYGAQYILGSTAREDTVAPGLYGIWHTTDTPLWNSDYHLNYNFMATFNGTYSSNRPELALSAVEALRDFMPVGEQSAASVTELKEIYPELVDKKIARGDIDPEKGIEDAILYPIGILPKCSNVAGYLNETLGAAYNACLMTEYYDYTMDEEFLKEKTYDYLLKCGNFYEKWLEKEDGEYVLYAGCHEGKLTKNPSVELNTAYGIFDCLINYSEVLGVDEDRRPVWKEIRDSLERQIPTDTYKGMTVYKLAEADPNGNPMGFDYTWTNVVVLDAFIPGNRLGYFSDPADLEIARNTLKAYEDYSISAWTNDNNFPRVFADAVRMRYPIEDIVTQMVNKINSQMAANLRIRDGYHGVEKSGATEAINNMLLISYDRITKIFPNWFVDKDAKFSNLRAKGAFTVSAEYDGTAQEAKNVTITSEKGQDMTLVVPWTDGATVKDSQGNIIETTKGEVENYPDEKTITFATTAGETYTVEKGETATEKPSKTTLEYFLNKAKEHQANGDVDNCVESIKNLFAEAIAEGEAVMADENATYSEVMDATVKLMKAIQALDIKAADKTDLEMAVELAQSIELTKYVEAGQAEFQQALAAAQEVLADGDAMQADADTAWNALVDAISNLRLKADKSTLEDLLNSLADLDLSQYTEESAAVFRTVLANAQAVLADETLTEDDQKAVDDAVQALNDAKDQLQLKDSSSGDGDTNTGDGSDNTGNGDSNTGNGDSQTPGNGDNSGNNGNAGNNNAGNSNVGNSNAKADAPKTGDTTMPFAMLAAVIALAAGAVAVGSVRKKQSR